MTNSDGSRLPLTDKDAALLALVTLEPNIASTRVAALLWPQADRRRGLNSLRQRLFRLRRAAKHPLVEPGDRLRLASGWRTDLREELQALDSDPHACPGELLGDFEYSAVGDALAAWVEQQRQAWRVQRLVRLERVARSHRAKGLYDLALVCAQRLVALEPLHESLHRMLIELHYLRGDRAAAIVAYDVCEEVLRRELHVAPEERTLALLRAVETMTVAPARLRAPIEAVTLQRPPRLIGRDADLAALLRIWDAGRHVVLVGEAGMGKTRLFEALAEQRGPAIAARAEAGDERGAGATIARLLVALRAAGMEDASLSSADHVVLARLAGAGHEGPSGDRPGPRRCRAALLAALEATSRSASDRLMLLDDLHFADRFSLDLLHLLLPALRAAGWRCGLAHRPGDAWVADLGWIGLLIEQGHAERRVLRPLSVDQAAELLASLDQDNADAAQQRARARALHRRCGGNPLFMLEYLRTSDGPEELHSTRVDDLLDQRVARLSEPALALAQVAFVAGPDMHVELATAALAKPVSSLVAPWAELELADVMQAERFSHDLMREAVGRTLAAPIRKSLAAGVARWLADHDGPAPQLADLWRQAGRWREAASACELAASQAFALGRLAEQVHWLEGAADAWQQVGDIARCNRQLVAAEASLAELGRYKEARATAERLLKQPSCLRDRAAGLAALATLRFNEVADEETLLLIREARQLALASGDRALEEQMFGLEAQSLCWMGRHEEGRTLLVPVAEAALRREHDAAVLNLALDCAEVLRMSGDYAGALALVEALRRDSATQPLIWRANALFLESEAAFVHAELERSEACLRQMRDLREYTMGGEGVTPEDVVLVERWVQLGRFRQALDLAPRALAAYEAEGNRWLIGTTRIAWALTYIRLGQPERARRLLSEVDDGDGSLRLRRLFALGLAHEADPSQAARRYTEALDEVTRSEVPAEGRWRVQGELLLHLPPGEAAGLADRLWLECQGSTRRLHVLSARLGVLDALRRAGRVDEAAWHAVAMVEILADPQIASWATATTWWLLHLALGADGRSEAAAHALRQGRAWIARTMAHVPAEFHGSFRGRVPAHRQLLAAPVMSR